LGKAGTVIARQDQAFTAAHHVLRELNIPFMAAYGTALGLHRSGDLIPSDNDADFAVFHEDLPPHDVLQSAMQRARIRPRWPGRSDPYAWECDGHRHPILYQYNHLPTRIGIDVYVLHRHSGAVWDYSGGGERTSRGHRFPDVELETVTDRKTGAELQAFPKAWLAVQYGENWLIPQKKAKEEDAPTEFVPNADPNTARCALPPPARAAA
jgi:hypothetical protein